MHNNRRKFQYITITIVFVSLTIFSLFASTTFHYILLGRDRVPQIYPLISCIKSTMANKNHSLLFLCFVILSACACAAILVTYSTNYKSKLQRITPAIYTPLAVGQNQHGSARWMKEEMKSKAFSTVVIDSKHKGIKLLLEAGIEDFDKIKSHRIDDELPVAKYKEQSFLLYKPIKKYFSKVLDKVLRKFLHSIWERQQLKEIEKLVDSDLPQEDEPRELLGERLDTKSSNSKEKQHNVRITMPPSKGGIVIGMEKISRHKELHYFVAEDIPTMCVGATRSGKSRTVVLQSICNLALAGESMILSDPKGELYQYSIEFLQRLGYTVVVLDFKNPLKSNKYNLLQPIIDAIDEDNIPEATECVWDLVSVLVGEAKGEKIWTNGEATTIDCAIMSVVYDNRTCENRKYQTLTNVYHFIAEMCKPVGKKMPIVEYVKQLPDNHPAKPLVAISEIAPERTRGSFYTAALTTLKLFTSSYINAMTNSSDYNPKNLGRKKMALFFVLPDERVTYYSIASILVLQHYIQLVNESDHRGGRLKIRVNCLLDEFGNFATIPNFDTLLTVGGGRGIRFNIFVQDFAQLENRYDEKVAKIIRGNCQTWIYLQTDNPETLKEISEKLGTYTVSTYSLSAQNNKYQTSSSSHSVNLTGRALLMPEEVKRITRPYSLVTSRLDPVIMNSPDLSKWQFNTMLGLGSEEHNIKVRDFRDKHRKERITKKEAERIELWSDCWKYWQSRCDESTVATVQQTFPRRQTFNREEDYY